jgi:deoxyribose-phosphate aldolase
MTNQDILAHVDHTALSAAATWLDVKRLCDEGVSYHTASVCIPPAYVKRAVDEYAPRLKVGTVAGFPLGYNAPAIKAAEAAQAVKDGADEVDMVINLGDVKNGDFDRVRSEIAAVKAECGSRILKVIVETCYLSRDEKVRLCAVVTEAGADFIKTSTGLGPAGAVLDDILLFKKHIGANIRVKAAGGIRTREAMEAFLEAGCDRIGTSAAKVLWQSNQKGSG